MLKCLRRRSLLSEDESTKANLEEEARWRSDFILSYDLNVRDLSTTMKVIIVKDASSECPL
jgi:hypothetical protein